MHDTLGWILGTGLQGDLRAVSLLGLPPGSAFVREVRLDQGGGLLNVNASQHGHPLTPKERWSWDGPSDIPCTESGGVSLTALCSSCGLPPGEAALLAKGHSQRGTPLRVVSSQQQQSVQLEE